MEGRNGGGIGPERVESSGDGAEDEGREDERGAVEIARLGWLIGTELRIDWRGKGYIDHHYLLLVLCRHGYDRQVEQSEIPSTAIYVIQEIDSTPHRYKSTHQNR